MSSLFVDAEYYMLLLVDEMKQQYDNVITCFDLFSKLMHENKRIWVNVRDRNWRIVNSFFIAREKLLEPLGNIFVVTDYYERGFYDKYYIVNCMNIVNFQYRQKLIELIAAAADQARQERKRAEEQKKFFGKQYNMFGGLD